LKRREKPERLRDDLIAKSDSRFREHVTEVARTAPYIGIEVARLFPHEPIVPPEAIYEFVRSPRSYDLLRHFIDNPKRIPNGVFSTANQNRLPFAELNTYGLVLTRSQLHLSPSRWTPNTGKLFVTPAQVIWTIGRSLRFAEHFFKWAKFSGNISIAAKFSNVLNQSLQYSDHEDEDLSYICSERDFSVNEITTTDEVSNNLVQLIVGLSRDAFWAFNCEYKDLEEKVSKVLTEDRLI
jgi:hypothetical protein